MNYKSYADLSIDIVDGIKKVPPSIELVVGIPRSGMIPAYMIGAHLNLQVVSLDEFCEGVTVSHGERKINTKIQEAKEILVVDDSYHSGTALQKAKSRLIDKVIAKNFYFSAIYSSAKEVDGLDFYFNYLPQPRVFQWNYKNHFITTQSAYDMDGVLCVDPTDEENDDSIEYIKFLTSAKPLFIPKYKIPCIITSRLEKYRIQTEKWLEDNGVEYDELIMLDLNSARERRKLKIHAKFKAKVLIDRPELYYFESNWKQAQEIFKLTQKPVFCTENDILINSWVDVVQFENSRLHSKRVINDVINESDEIGDFYKKLQVKFNNEIQSHNKTKNRLQKLESNKWFKFSKLSKRNKLLFLIKHMIRTISN